jgi:hypothetical protein
LCPGGNEVPDRIMINEILLCARRRVAPGTQPAQNKNPGAAAGVFFSKASDRAQKR